ncbi:hypothetical protein BD289DRAFT_489898 [Coniella lustricola]|uniref:Uncharacterized protein n=1 Tax=Coniella lustricola TaxID=2025994 RepID=A0A2T3A1A2_9PEZI|nr:hypothetical protein BD289DRAFT_489898 [Coniella lustricola]
MTIEAALVSYIHDVLFHNSTREEIASLVATYPKNPDSPAGIGVSNDTYSEFKRLCAILGDWEFVLITWLLLTTVQATVPAWSYQATYGSGTLTLGTYHSTDLSHILRDGRYKYRHSGFIYLLCGFLGPQQLRGQ